jgi:superfamily II DNA or RNA helicase
LRRGIDEANALTGLLQERADIAKKAVGKLSFAVEAFAAHPGLRRVLVYCDDNVQLAAVNDRLSTMGVSTVQYVGEMDEQERASAIRAIEGGAARAVLSMRCLDEGVDIPSCDGAVILASSKTWREFIQRRGRVLRLYPDKPFATIVDPIVLPPGRSTGGVEALVSGEIHRACVFVRDSENRATGESIARRICLAHHIPYEEVEADSRGPV